MTWKPIHGATTLGDGELREFNADGITILLVRSGGEVFAFPPFCPHQEEELEISGICEGGGRHLQQASLAVEYADREGNGRGRTAPVEIRNPA